MSRRWISIAALAIGLAATARAKADIYELPKSDLVMNRTYVVKNEMGVMLGYLPIGAINKYVSAGFNYINFFNDYHGWEVVHFQYTHELVQNLKKTLREPPWYAAEEDLPTLKMIVTSNYVFSPFYSKATLFNSKVIHTQLMFSIGPGIAQFKDRMSALVDLGITQRFFLSPTSSLKFDFRYYPYLSSQPLARTQMALLGVYSWSFGAK